MWWEKIFKPRCKAIDRFRQQYPNVPIVKWEYVNQDDASLVTIYTDKEILTVQYNPDWKRSMIIGMNE